MASQAEAEANGNQPRWADHWCSRTRPAVPAVNRRPPRAEQQGSSRTGRPTSLPLSGPGQANRKRPPRAAGAHESRQTAAHGRQEDPLEAGVSVSRPRRTDGGAECGRPGGHPPSRGQRGRGGQAALPIQPPCRAARAGRRRPLGPSAEGCWQAHSGKRQAGGPAGRAQTWRTGAKHRQPGQPLEPRTRVGLGRAGARLLRQAGRQDGPGGPALCGQIVDSRGRQAVESSNAPAVVRERGMPEQPSREARPGPARPRSAPGPEAPVPVVPRAPRMPAPPARPPAGGRQAGRVGKWRGVRGRRDAAESG